MAYMRIRTYKPAFFSDARLFRMERDSGLPVRMAYLGLISAADREGRLAVDVDELRAQIFPFEEVDFEAVLKVLADNGRVRLYEVDGVRLCWIIRFGIHQAINGREAASILPPWEGDDGAVPSRLDPVVPIPPVENAILTRDSRDDDALTTILTRDSRDDDALTTREPRVNDATLSGASTSESHVDDARNKERKGKEEENNNNAGASVEASSVPALDVEPVDDHSPAELNRWFEFHDDRLVKTIAQTIANVPKFAVPENFNKYATREKVEKLVADLRELAPADEAITFQLDNWQTYNEKQPKKGGEKDAVAALRNWFRNDIGRWALAKKKGSGTSTPARSPARESVRDASSRRKGNG